MSAFASISAPELPRIACVGTIEEVADTKASQSGTYNVTKLTIKPHGGGYDTNVFLLTRPEWLAPGFEPDKELEGNSSAQFVYRTHIAPPPGRREIGHIAGIAGTEEAANSLAEEIQSAATEQADEDGNTVLAVDPDVLTSLIRKYAKKPVGYVLRQKVEKLENGQRVRTNQYELETFFYPTEDSLNYYRKRATSTPEKLKVAFDEAF